MPMHCNGRKHLIALMLSTSTVLSHHCPLVAPRPRCHLHYARATPISVLAHASERSPLSSPAWLVFYPCARTTLTLHTGVHLLLASLSSALVMSSYFPASRPQCRCHATATLRPPSSTLLLAPQLPNLTVISVSLAWRPRLVLIGFLFLGFRWWFMCSWCICFPTGYAPLVFLGLALCDGGVWFFSSFVCCCWLLRLHLCIFLVALCVLPKVATL
jgi:hypothetical protein